MNAGNYEMVLIADYELAKAVCAKEEFADRAQLAFFENVGYLISTNGGKFFFHLLSDTATKDSH
jgi:hypothetical protein